MSAKKIPAFRPVFKVNAWQNQTPLILPEEPLAKLKAIGIFILLYNIIVLKIYCLPDVTTLAYSIYFLKNFLLKFTLKNPKLKILRTKENKITMVNINRNKAIPRSRFWFPEIPNVVLSFIKSTSGTMKKLKSFYSNCNVNYNTDSDFYGLMVFYEENY